VFGTRGQLGAAVAEECAGSHEVFTFARGDVEVTSDAAVAEALARVRPEAIVNGVAYTDVDGSEDHPVDALNGNAFAIRALARAAEATGAALVHYSSDFVFDGMATAPYTEEDRPNPRSAYAASKLLGEWFALETPAAYVLRVESLFGGHPAKSSIDKILAGIENGTPVRVFSDRTVTPSYVADVTAATEALLKGRPPYGVYHCVNSGVTTWHGVAVEAARLLQREADIVPVKSDEVKLRARRPRYCALSNLKLAEAGVAMPSWQEALARYVSLSRD
jgi:dTDP-4-dehydrorhamnose reductase